MRRGSKYGNRKISTPDGTFDSEREYRRWRELQLLEMAGEIGALRRQVPFQLLPAQYDRGTGKLLERSVSYVADFVYQTDGFTVVEDAKGFRTPEYILKRKLMLYIHGLKVQEV
ncbi:MAG: DUF1064 domain-containing protein [Oscillospiraceae bacterium]|nr:DUF1064 domain-containing protein [Oscillospiraceae bacterium]